ncbi:MAG: amidohydrolase [Promethearchaeota archaeon]
METSSDNLDKRCTIFKNAHILTMAQNGASSMGLNVDSFAIADEKFIAVGDYESVKNEVKTQGYGDGDVQEIDLTGKCVVPGFIDSHTHPIIAIYLKSQLNLSEIKSYKALEEKIRDAAKKIKEGEWILAYDLMEDTFDDPNERYFPDAEKLDSICDSNPILILRHDGHICGVNSKALEMIGVNKDNVKEKKVEGGEIRVYSDGRPSGIFTENAVSIALDAVPLSLERLENAAREYTQELASCGITTCGGILQLEEEGPAGKMGAIEVSFMQALLRKDIFLQDFVFFLITSKPKKLKRMKKSFERIDANRGRFLVGGLKMFADGTFGASTCYMFEPFEDCDKSLPYEKQNRGLMVHPEDYLYNLAKETLELGLGFHVECHAIGDKANRIMVDIYKKIIDEDKKTNNFIEKTGSRFHLEHASMLTEDTLVDAIDANLIFVCQPMFIKSEHTWLEKRFGKKRLKIIYPFKSIIEKGGIIAGSSDAPIESFNVLEAIRVSVTREGFVPEQRISVMDALRMFTMGSAHALGQEKIKGSIEKGKMADFVILDKNIDQLDDKPEELSSVNVLKTYHRGKLIYSNPSSS